MSFSKTISTIAALASIFGAATAGWKLAESNSQQPPTVLDEKLNQLDKKIEDLSKPAPVPVPQAAPAPVVAAPAPVILPTSQPTPPPPPPVPQEETQP
ncbi:cadherin [Synechococcus phage S-CREM1]|nr:cadherin [Synechococcus phage S-CREM1]